MIIPIDDEISFEIHFDLTDREEGFEDDMAFIIRETVPKGFRIFASDETQLLLTPYQADQLALGLKEAAEQSRKTSR